MAIESNQEKNQRTDTKNKAKKIRSNSIKGINREVQYYHLDVLKMDSTINIKNVSSSTSHKKTPSLREFNSVGAETRDKEGTVPSFAL